MLSRLANGIQSVTSMVVFVVLILIADYFIFSTGFTDLDTASLKTMETNIRTLVQLSAATGVSPIEMAPYVITPIGQGGIVTPTLMIIESDAKGCSSEIVEGTYRVECIYRSGVTLLAQANRADAQALIWRDIGLAASTTVPGFAFLISFAVISTRRRRQLIATNMELENRNRILQSTTFALVHDVRGPLDNVLFARDLLKESLTQEQIDEMGLSDVVSLLSDGVDSQISIMDGLRDWMQASKGDMPTELVSLTDAANELVGHSGYLADVQVGDLPTRRINANLFKRVLDNLIRNSIAHSDKADTWVKVYAEGDSIVVQDNGSGFDVSQFDKMTMPFQRGSNSSGSGLGLAIVRQIVEARGDRLRAESTPGVGTKMIIDMGPA